MFDCFGTEAKRREAANNLIDPLEGVGENLNLIGSGDQEKSESTSLTSHQNPDESKTCKLEDYRDEMTCLGVFIGTLIIIGIIVGIEKSGSSTPTSSPTSSPTENPTESPTQTPTIMGPTQTPTTSSPIGNPTQTPTTSSPIETPTQTPTSLPPTFSPTTGPTQTPTLAPTERPTSPPTHNPTHMPTASPTSCVDVQSNLNYGLSVNSNPEAYNVDIELMNNGNVSWILNMIEFVTNIRIPHDAFRGLPSPFTLEYHNDTHGITHVITTNESIDIPASFTQKISYTLPQPNTPSDLSSAMLLPPDNFGTGLNNVPQNVVYENSDKCARRNIPQQFSADSIIANSDVNTYVLGGVYIQDSGEVNCYNVSDFNQKLADAKIWKNQRPAARDISLLVNYNALGPTNNPSKLNAFSASLQNPSRSIIPTAIVLDQTNDDSSVHTPIYTPEYEAALVPQVAAMKGSLEYTSLQLIEPFNESLSNKTTQEIMKTVDDVWQLTVFNNPNIADTPLQYRNTPLSELNVTQFPSNKVVTIVDTRMECNLVQNPINGSDPINNVNSGIPFPGSTDKFSYCAIDSTYTCASPQNPPVNAQSLNYTAPDSEDGSNSNIFNSFINYVCSGSGKASNVDKLVAKNANVHIQGGKGNGQLEGAEGKMFDQVVADCIVGNNNVYTNAQKRFEISDDRSAGRNSNAMFSNNTNRQAAGLVGMAVISPIVILLSAGLILGLAGVCYLIQRYKNSGQNKTTENDIENPKTNVELDNIEGKKFR